MAIGLRPAAAGFAVGGDCELEQNVGTAFGDAKDVAGVIVSRLVRTDSDIDGNAGGPQPSVPLTCHFGIGIFQRRHHPR